jgi:UDP-N-acetylmuramoylalanine--D-glutamate ligase
MKELYYVFGLGISGISACRRLEALNKIVIAWDDNEQTRIKFSLENPKIEMSHFKELNWKNVLYIVLAPSVPLYFPEPHEVVSLAKKNNCKIIGDIELLYLFNPNSKFIGITGLLFHLTFRNKWKIDNNKFNLSFVKSKWI